MIINYYKANVPCVNLIDQLLSFAQSSVGQILTPSPPSCLLHKSQVNFPIYSQELLEM